MKKQIVTELLKPHIYLDSVIMAVLSLAVLAKSIPLGIIAIIITIAVYFVHLRLADAFSKPIYEAHEQQILAENSRITEQFALNSTQALCEIDKNGKIFWKNQAFSDVLPDATTLTGTLSKDAMDQLFAEDKAQTELGLEGRIFAISAAAPGEDREKRLLFWEDITLLRETETLYEDSKDCLAAISVDNYDEIMSSTPTEEQSQVIAQIDRKLRSWAAELEGAAIRYKTDSYAVFFEKKKLEELKAQRFPILDDMHGIETGADFPTSISVGLAYDAANPAELQKEAVLALDLAQGRGGDQLVLKAGSKDAEYFGGALPTVEKRNKGKSRIVAHALMQQMAAADRVLIMGHTRPDMDAIGSAIGVYCLTRMAGKPADIVLNTVGEAIEQIYNAADATGEYSFINTEEALQRITKDTLLVVVDVHSAAMTEAPELLEHVKNVVIIDHHRRTKGAIENATLVHIEVYASSASELVTELIQYAKDRPTLTKFEADALLAGITLDTKNFTINSGVRTFDAASWLRRNGADSSAVRGFFKQRLEFVQKKYNLIASAEVVGNGIAVAYTRETDPAMQVLTAQAADELLDMKGVRAAFAAGRGTNKTMLSARSLGQVNVQTIMEKMGGGGHMNSAATQLDISPEEAIQQLVQLLRDDKLI